MSETHTISTFENVVSTFENVAAGIKATVAYDPDAGSFSPRDWDNAWQLVGFKSRHRTFGDEQLDLAQLIETDDGSINLTAYLRMNHEAHLIVPVSFYEHGLVRYYAGTKADRWDGGAAGAALLTKDQLGSDFDGDEQSAREALDAELETFTDWCNGTVYCVLVEDASGAVLDSLGDIYGLDHAEAEAKSMLKAELQDWRDEQEARRYWAARDVETIER